MKLRNSSYRLEGLIGYEQRADINRLSEESGVNAEVIVSFALQCLFELPQEMRSQFLREYYQLLKNTPKQRPEAELAIAGQRPGAYTRYR